MRVRATKEIQLICGNNNNNTKFQKSLTKHASKSMDNIKYD